MFKKSNVSYYQNLESVTLEKRETYGFFIFQFWNNPKNIAMKNHQKGLKFIMGQTFLSTLAPCTSVVAPALTTQNVFAKVKKLSSVQYSQVNPKVVG